MIFLYLRIHHLVLIMSDTSNRAQCRCNARILMFIWQRYRSLFQLQIDRHATT